MLWALATVALGHPGAALHLEATRSEVQASPCDVELRLSRARALTHDARTDDALHELDHAESCGADPLDIALARGITLRDRPDEALPWLDQVLDQTPSHAGALATRAAVHTALGDPERALADWTAVLERAPTPDAAHAAARAATELGRLDNGLRLLDATAAELGAPSLQRLAVELALDAGRPELAWARLATAPQTAPWWQLKARTLDALGETERAATARHTAAALGDR